MLADVSILVERLSHAGNHVAHTHYRRRQDHQFILYIVVLSKLYQFADGIKPRIVGVAMEFYPLKEGILLVEITSHQVANRSLEDTSQFPVIEIFPVIRFISEEH